MRDLSLENRLEALIAEKARLDALIEVKEGTIAIYGSARSARQRDLVRQLLVTAAPGLAMEDHLVLDAEFPWQEEDMPPAELLLESEDVDIQPDVPVHPEDEPIAPADVSDETEGGAEPAFAPVDPVLTTDLHGRPVVLGGFSSDSMESIEVSASAEDARPGDEALAEAVRRELLEDAATTDLPLQVFVRRGIVHLRGVVADLDDIDNAESVAGRVPGVHDVIDEMMLPTAS